MPGSMCPSLQRLSLLLLSAYKRRDLIAQRGSFGTARTSAEVDLERVNHLIARHRKFCPHCKLNTISLDSPSPAKVLRCEVVFIQ